MKLNEPVHKILVLLACVISDRSDDEHARPRCLVEAFTPDPVYWIRVYSKDVDDNSGKNNSSRPIR